MAYVIASPRLGTVGDTYEPADGVNIEALIEGWVYQIHQQEHKI